MSQRCNHTDPVNCPTCTPQPPFKKGDWLVTRPSSFPDYIPYQLHQATEDPRKKLSGSGWTYMARTVFGGGKDISEMDAGHFSKATKEDLMKEHARLHGELDVLQARMSELLSAAEGLS